MQFVIYAIVLLIAAILKFGFLPVAASILGPIILIIILIWSFIRFKDYRDEQKNKRKAEEERRKREELNRQNEIKRQERIYESMKILGENSLSAFESLPKCLEEAENHLDKAKYDFSENALSPFWESIENAYIELGSFNEEMQNIKGNLSNYESLAKQYENNPPEFPLSRSSIEKLNTSCPIFERANNLVREAQKNPDFANIYEMRRTQKIMIAGFSNLSEAINNMGQEIEGSIRTLSETVDSTSLRLDELKSTVEAQTDEIKVIDKSEKQERKSREERALNMLDDIHRIQRKKHVGY